MMNMLFGNILLLLNLLYFSSNMMEKRYKNNALFILTIVLSTLFLAVRSYPNMETLGTLVMAVCYLVFVCFFFIGSLQKKLGLILYFVVTSSFSDLIAANIMNLFFDLKSSDINSLLYTFALLLSNVINFGLLFTTCKFFYIKEHISLPKSVYLLFVFPIITLVYLHNLNTHFETFRNDTVSMIFVFGLLISNAIVVYVFYEVIKTIELKKEIKSIKLKYDTLHTLYENNFNFLHDTSRKIDNLYGYLQKNEFDEISHEIESLKLDLLKKFNIINSNSSLVSSILNYRLEDIINYNVVVKTDIFYNDFSFLPINCQLELFSLIINMGIDTCIESKQEKTIFILKVESKGCKVILSFKYTDTIKTNQDILDLKKQLESIHFDNCSYIDIQKSNGYCQGMMLFQMN